MIRGLKIYAKLYVSGVSFDLFLSSEIKKKRGVVFPKTFDNLPEIIPEYQILA